MQLSIFLPAMEAACARLKGCKACPVLLLHEKLSFQTDNLFWSFSEACNFGALWRKWAILPLFPFHFPKRKKKRASHKPTRGHTHGTRRPVCHILNSAPALPVLETVNKILATSILIRTSQAIFFKPYSQTWQKHFNCMCFGLLSQIRAKHLLCAIFDRGDNLVNVLSNWKVEFFWDVSETLITGGVPGLVVINILSSLNLN